MIGRFDINNDQQNPMLYDAFGRARVSETGNRFDCEFIYDLQEEIIDEVKNGSGSITHQPVSGDVLLENNGTALTDYAGLYSYDIPYTAGNSQLIEITSVLDYAGLGSGTAQLFLRSKVSGVVTEEVYNQNDWTEPNGDLDWTNSQIFIMDFQSLKVGKIRYGFNRGGIATLVHEIENDNLRDSGYWRTPTLPVYWRIYNDATYTYMEIGYGDTENAIGFRYRIALNANGQMIAICATVKSEGGLELFSMAGFNRSADMGIAAKTVGVTLIPLLSIRPKSLFNGIENHGLYIPLNINIQTDNPIRIVLLHDNLLTGAVWNDVDTTQSGLEFDITASAYTNGHIIHSEYIATSKNTATGDTATLGRNLLWRRRGTESGILTLCAVRTTGISATVLASIKCNEIR